MSESRKPVHTIRQGLVQAAIWQNEHDNNTYFTVTFERRYKDGDQWKSTQGFGRDDLLVLAKIADLAHSKIHELQSAARSTRQANASESRRPAAAGSAGARPSR